MYMYMYINVFNVLHYLIETLGLLRHLFTNYAILFITTNIIQTTNIVPNHHTPFTTNTPNVKLRTRHPSRHARLHHPFYHRISSFHTSIHIRAGDAVRRDAGQVGPAAGQRHLEVVVVVAEVHGALR